MMTPAEKMRAFTAKQHELRQEFFNDCMKDVFDAYPALQEIRWNQYTPYFNDGEPCNFSVYDFDLNGHSSWDLGYQIKEIVKKIEAEKSDASKMLFGSETITELEKELAEIQKLEQASEEINEIMQSADDSFFLSLFGDHVTVTVNREGVKVESYEDHD